MAPEDYLQHIDFAATTKLDFTPLFANPKVFRSLVLDLCRPFRAANINKVACPESIGFILGSAVAAELKLGLIPIRKAGKLPGELLEQSYALEYGEARLSIQASRQLNGRRVVLCDDLLATGGTLEAAAKLVARCGGTLAGAVCIIELTGLKGRSRIDCPVKALQTYEF